MAATVRHIYLSVWSVGTLLKELFFRSWGHGTDYHMGKGPIGFHKRFGVQFISRLYELNSQWCLQKQARHANFFYFCLKIICFFNGPTKSHTPWLQLQSHMHHKIVNKKSRTEANNVWSKYCLRSTHRSNSTQAAKFSFYGLYSTSWICCFY